MLKNKVRELAMKYVIENQDSFLDDNGCISMKAIENLSYEDFQKIISKNQIEIVDEIYKCIESLVGEKINHNVNIHVASIPKSAAFNLEKGLLSGDWSFTRGAKGKRDEYKRDDLYRIKKNDLFMTIEEFESEVDNRRTGRPSLEEYFGKYKRIRCFVVTREMKEISDSYKIWDDGKEYPYLIGIDNRAIFDVTDIPCNDDYIGSYLRNTIRNFNSFSSVRQIDMSSMLKFIYYKNL